MNAYKIVPRKDTRDEAQPKQAQLCLTGWCLLTAKIIPGIAVGESERKRATHALSAFCKKALGKHGSYLSNYNYSNCHHCVFILILLNP